MKYNKLFNSYGKKLASNAARRDRGFLNDVHRVFEDISIYINGLLLLIKQEQSKSDDAFDYAGFDRNSRRYMSQLETQIYNGYKLIVKSYNDASRAIFYEYRDEFSGVIKKANFKLKTQVKEASGVNLVFGGTASQAFTSHLRSQLQAGVDPAALIVTVSQEHVKLIQKQMLTAVAKGKGFGWSTDNVIKEMYPKGIDEEIKKTVEYNINRISRTSFMQAVNNDTTEFVDLNKDAFIGSRRVADGRPCIACVVQDGNFYPPGEPLIDHPNGMCQLVPIPFPDEYFLTGKITKPIDDTFDEPLLSKFYKMSDAEQKRIFANDSLYKLWKEEKFDINKVVVGKFGTPISYQQAVLHLDELGGITASRDKLSFLHSKDKNILTIMDPVDRTLGHRFLYTTKVMKSESIDSRSINLVGSGEDFASSSISNAKKARIMALYGDEKNLDWYRFNMRARELGIYTRKTIKGSFYFAIPKGK